MRCSMSWTRHGVTEVVATDTAQKTAFRRTALDGASRRRFYLFRRGALDYADDSGEWVGDPDAGDMEHLANRLPRMDS